MFRTVTYTSFASVGLQPFEVEEIAARSRKNNCLDAVTGVLIFNGGANAQTIEGPPAAIQNLLDRLYVDDRHCRICVRDDRLSGKRIFPNWAMGYVHLGLGSLDGQLELAEALSHDMPQEVHDILLSMAATLPFG